MKKANKLRPTATQSRKPQLLSFALCEFAMLILEHSSEIRSQKCLSNEMENRLTQFGLESLRVTFESRFDNVPQNAA